MALYYVLPLIGGPFLATVLTSVLTKITETTNATIRNAFLLVAGCTILNNLFGSVLPGFTASFVLLQFFQYVLIIKIYKVPYHFGLVFLFLNFVFGTTINLILVKQFSNLVMSML